jgi:hypothetical protein
VRRCDLLAAPAPSHIAMTRRLCRSLGRRSGPAGAVSLSREWPAAAEPLCGAPSRGGFDLRRVLAVTAATVLTAAACAGGSGVGADRGSEDLAPAVTSAPTAEPEIAAPAAQPRTKAATASPSPAANRESVVGRRLPASLATPPASEAEPPQTATAVADDAAMPDPTVTPPPPPAKPTQRCPPVLP